MTTLIADSGSTKTDWELVDDAGQILFTGKTQGINPFHLSDDDIWKILAEELTLPAVPARVFFYGSGVTESMKPRMEHYCSNNFHKQRFMPRAICWVQPEPCWDDVQA